MKHWPHCTVTPGDGQTTGRDGAERDELRDRDADKAFDNLVSAVYNRDALVHVRHRG